MRYYTAFDNELEAYLETAYQDKDQLLDDLMESGITDYEVVILEGRK